MIRPGVELVAFLELGGASCKSRVNRACMRSEPGCRATQMLPGLHASQNIVRTEAGGATGISMIALQNMHYSLQKSPLCSVAERLPDKSKNSLVKIHSG